MPIYEFQCLQCKKKFSELIGVVYKEDEISCPKCGGKKLKKLISRFSFFKSEEEKLESLVDPSKIGDMNDPKNLKKWAKRLGKEMGEDLPEDFDEELEKAEEEMAAEKEIEQEEE